MTETSPHDKNAVFRFWVLCKLVGGFGRNHLDPSTFAKNDASNCENVFLFHCCGSTAHLRFLVQRGPPPLAQDYSLDVGPDQRIQQFSPVFSRVAFATTYTACSAMREKCPGGFGAGNSGGRVHRQAE